MKSQASAALTIEPHAKVPPISDKTKETAAPAKITRPKSLHFSDLIPKRLKIPARSIKIPTAAPIIAAISKARMALIAVIGAAIPQIM